MAKKAKKAEKAEAVGMVGTPPMSRKLNRLLYNFLTTMEAYASGRRTLTGRGLPVEVEAAQAARAALYEYLSEIEGKVKSLEKCPRCDLPCVPLTPEQRIKVGAFW